MDSPFPPHGGRPDDLYNLYPDAPRPLVDLSTGINPHPYALSGQDENLWHRLPEPGLEARLIKAAAHAYRVPAHLVVPGPGTQILIGLLPRFLEPSSVRILEPTYSGHRTAWCLAGYRPVSVASADALLTPGRGDVSVLCSPNNPDGRIVSLPVLSQLADRHAGQNGVLIVDEAFADFEMDQASSLLPHPGLIVFRSFGKTYGLAGARVGFLLGDHPALSALRQAMGPWCITGPGHMIASRALLDDAWRSAMKARLSGEMARLRQLLDGAGLAFCGGTRLFGLFAHPSASALWHHLAQAGLLTRRFEHDQARLRFGLPGDEAGWSRLASSLSDAGYRSTVCRSLQTRQCSAESDCTKGGASLSLSPS